MCNERMKKPQGDTIWYDGGEDEDEDEYEIYNDATDNDEEKRREEKRREEKRRREERREEKRVDERSKNWYDMKNDAKVTIWWRAIEI